jgi:hypothetical protein
VRVCPYVGAVGSTVRAPGSQAMLRPLRRNLCPSKGPIWKAEEWIASDGVAEWIWVPAGGVPVARHRLIPMGRGRRTCACQRACGIILARR